MHALNIDLYSNLIASPLEQFRVIPLISLYFSFIDFSITNETVVLLLIFFFTLISGITLIKNENSFLIIPSPFQSFLEAIYNLVLSLVVDNIKGNRGQFFFPLIFFLFFFILSVNVIGLVPCSFTLTSHLILTFSLSVSIFVGINIICIKTHGIRFFALFLPNGSSFILAFLLVPIELVSYIFKPISLSIRLFANMMAGHTLLKVIAGFGSILSKSVGFLFFTHYIPLLILVPLFCLESGIALIQSFVFCVLICIYINDSLNLH